jgi:hypothetical protein
MMGVRRPPSVVRFGGRNKRLPERPPEPLVRKAGLAASVYNRARRAKRPTKKVGPDIAEDDGLKAGAVLVAHGLFRQGLGPAIRIGALSMAQRRRLIDTTQMPAADVRSLGPQRRAEELSGGAEVPCSRYAPRRAAIAADLSASGALWG